MIGRTIALFKVAAKHGAGGMGEVYRAWNTRSYRDAALTVLPASFSDDQHHMGRFKRKAQLSAALHHPKITSIHGLRAGNSKGGRVLGPVVFDRLEELKPAVLTDCRNDRIGCGCRTGQSHSIESLTYPSIHRTLCFQILTSPLQVDSTDHEKTITQRITLVRFSSLGDCNCVHTANH